MTLLKQFKANTKSELVADDSIPLGTLRCGSEEVYFSGARKIQIAIEDLILRCQANRSDTSTILIHPEDLAAYNTRAYLTNSYHIVADKKEQK